MIKYFLSLSFFLVISSTYSQSDLSNAILPEVASKTCGCIEKIKTKNKSKSDLNLEVKECIDAQVSVYIMSFDLQGVLDNVSLEKNEEIKNTDSIASKEINVVFNTDENSEEYIKGYYEIERALFENCDYLKEIVASDNDESPVSISNNQEAYENYYLGIDEYKKGKYKKAIKYYKKAVEIDPYFAFAWDNLGLSYRKSDNNDKAILAYEKSLEIDPYGTTPLQNIAIAYIHKEEYLKAIDAYTRLGNLYKSNPEVYYGLGRIYAINLKDYENGLSNTCVAYNLYVDQSSPYRTDAETMITFIYAEMKKEGKEEKFLEILKENNINPEF